MLGRVNRIFQEYVNTHTPYPNLILRSQLYERPILKQITMIVCAILSVLHVVNRGSWQIRNVVPVSTPAEQKPLLSRAIGVNAQLDTSNIKSIDKFEFDETVPAFMDKYTCVCPFKPCGYTEFVWGEIAQGPSEVDAAGGIAYKGRIIRDAGERRQIQNERDASVKGIVESYFSSHQFDNINLITKTAQGEGREYRACHPQTIYELCQMNRILIQRHTEGSGISSFEIPSEAQKNKASALKAELLDNLAKGKVHEVARLFLLLSEIPYSLPIPLFHAAFGDLLTPQINQVNLPQYLENMKLFYREFSSGYSEQTIRNIVAYYYHKGSTNPLAQASITLKALPKDKGHYCVVGEQILKANHIQ